MSGRILVTGVGGPAGAGVAGWLGSVGADVIGADADPRALESAAVPAIGLPLASDPGFIPALIRAAHEHHVTSVVPTVSEELPVLARERDAIRRSAGIDILVAGPMPVAVANDKLLTASTLASAGLSVPRFSALGTRPDSEVLERLGLPAVTKPRISRGGREVRVHRSSRSLLEAWPSRPSLAQEFVPGTEYAVQLAIANGSAKAVVLEKTELRDGEVGNAADVIRVDEPVVAALAIQAARAIGLTGALDVDVRKTEAGEPQVLEINARFGAWATSAPEVLKAALGALVSELALAS